MPNNEDLSVFEINNETATAVVYQEGTTTPQSLSGATIELYVKTTASTTDGDSSTVKLSTATGEITITDAANGAISITFPSFASPGTRWYRLDTIITGKRRTAAYGNFVITNV